VFKDPDLYFYWVPLIDVLGEQLLDPEIGPELNFTYEEQLEGDTFVFSDFCTGFWMKHGMFIYAFSLFLNLQKETKGVLLP
jgi:hypothetical protein